MNKNSKKLVVFALMALFMINPATAYINWKKVGLWASVIGLVAIKYIYLVPAEEENSNSFENNKEKEQEEKKEEKIDLMEISDFSKVKITESLETDLEKELFSVFYSANQADWCNDTVMKKIFLNQYNSSLIQTSRYGKINNKIVALLFDEKDSTRFCEHSKKFTKIFRVFANSYNYAHELVKSLGYPDCYVLHSLHYLSDKNSEKFERYYVHVQL